MKPTKDHGGARVGAGRPHGSTNRRTISAIEEVKRRFPKWTPLLHFAEVANDQSLPTEVRLEAARAAAPYFHPKPKPVEFFVDAAVDLEQKLASVRAASHPSAAPI